MRFDALLERRERILELPSEDKRASASIGHNKVAVIVDLRLSVCLLLRVDLKLLFSFLCATHADQSHSIYVMGLPLFWIDFQGVRGRFRGLCKLSDLKVRVCKTVMWESAISMRGNDARIFGQSIGVL